MAENATSNISLSAEDAAKLKDCKPGDKLEITVGQMEGMDLPVTSIEPCEKEPEATAEEDGSKDQPGAITKLLA